MTNDATQNPTNKHARYSGAGAGGVSEVIPTRAEAARGLQPFSTNGAGAPTRTIALGLVAALGAIVAGAAVWKARQPKDLPSRILRRVGKR